MGSRVMQMLLQAPEASVQGQYRRKCHGSKPQKVGPSQSSCKADQQSPANKLFHMPILVALNSHHRHSELRGRNGVSFSNLETSPALGVLARVLR